MMIDDSLATRLATLSEESNTSPISEEGRKTPTSLDTYLLLLTKAENECYIDYLDGARRLYKYLSPIIIDYPSDRKIDRVPALLTGYYTAELEKILAPRRAGEELDSWLDRRNIASINILYAMIHYVLPKLYE